MNNKLRKELIDIAMQKIDSSDVSHDHEHMLRVLRNAEQIAMKEKADLDIIIPSAIFHDIICYPKDDKHSSYSANQSADFASKILNKIEDFPKKKIEKVHICIKQCSFSKDITPNFLEGKIIQDADGLEATGAISIMRTFSSTGQMKRLFYHSEDPFCESREPDDLKFAIDLFYTRLLKMEKRMHTESAKKIAKRRTNFLKEFLSELELELRER